METIEKWLTAHVLVRVALKYAVPPVVAGVMAALGVLGLIPPEAVAACRAALGL